MERVSEYLSTSILLVSSNAPTQSDAYNAGYQVGHLVSQALPFIGVIVVLLAAWFSYRAWRKRRNSSGPQA